MTNTVLCMLPEVIENQLDASTMILVVEAQKLDELISSCGQLLDLLQPRQPGRVEVKWWIDAQGASRGRSPYLIELCTSHRAGGAGRWYQKKISRKNLVRRAKTRAGFIETHEQVRAVLGSLAFLLERREILLRLIGSHAMICKRMQSFHLTKIPDIEWTLKGIVDLTAPFTVEDDRVEGAFRLDMNAFVGQKLRGLFQATLPDGEEPSN